MVTIVDCRVPTEQFALAHTFALRSDLHVEIERFAAQDTDSAMPFVWVAVGDFESFEAALDEDSTVESFSSLTEFEDERLYRMSWVEEVELVMQLLIEEQCAITTARSSGDSWELQVMCPEREALSRTYEFCEKHGLSLTVDSIYELDEKDHLEFGLTEAQYETLVAAKRAGYYDVPRKVSLSELADDLGVSHQALSERLRRAHANLIERTISSPDEQDRARPEPLH
jgi:predicted DNA binding protein